MGADQVAVLARTCTGVRPGEAADAVDGLVPTAVAFPATVAEASDLLRAASDLGLAVLPRGTGTKLNWGVPPDRCDLVVDTTGLDRVVEHAAGDLVVRVQAGLAMAELATTLASAGQQLALDTPSTVSGPGSSAAEPPPPPAAAPSRTTGAAGDAVGTVGGVIATGSAGPRRLRYGAPRDLLIGITVVLADGTIASSGGKVVKNVAGYDLGKLFAGSQGTLGLIAEAVFRLHPLPQSSTYLTLTCPTGADAADRVRASIESQLVPSAAEIDRPTPTAPLSVGLLLEGSADAHPERVARMRELLGPGTEARPEPPAWWGRRVTEPGGVGLRIAFPPGALATVLAAVDEAADAYSGAAGQGATVCPAVRGSAGVGVLEIGLDGGAVPDAVRSFVTALRRRLAAPPAWGELPGASVTVVRAPATVHNVVAPFGPISALDVMRAVKDQFDPGHRMSPGRFAGGI